MNNRHPPARGVIAYDGATGRILHAHFTDVGRPPEGRQDPAETQLRLWLASEAAEIRLLHIQPGELDQGGLYRVDIRTGRLVPAAGGEGGFAASAGSGRGPTGRPPHT